MKKYYVILFAISFIFGACKKDDTLDELSMFIEGEVLDEETGSPIEGAVISLTTLGETYTDTTDVDGLFSLGEFISGTYEVYVTKSGYTKESLTASTYSVAVNEETELAVYNGTVELSPLNQSMSCTVFKQYQHNSDVTTVAANIDYSIYYSGQNGSITGTTNSNGLISLDSLPFNRTVDIYFSFTENSIIYKNTYSYNTGEDISQISVYGYDANGYLSVVSSSLLDDAGDGVENFDPENEINISFSMPVDSASTSFTLSNSTIYATWSNNYMKATIVPASALSNSTTYSFYYYVYNSTETQYTSDKISFTTKD